MYKVTTRESFLQELKKHLPEKVWCAEIGVFRGDFSQMILDIINPIGLTLIDPFITEHGHTYGAELHYLPTAYSGDEQYYDVLKRFQHFGNRVFIYREFSYNCTNKFFDQSFDFIYHDASHLYEDLKRDLVDWLPKVNEHGLVCGHDYTDNPAFGVRQAVDEFCKENNFEMIILNEQGGDFALKRK